MRLGPGDPGRIPTEPAPGAERTGSAPAIAVMVAIAFAVCVLVVVNTPTYRQSRPTCPDGYALISGSFQKAVCAPGYVEPVRR